MRYWIFLLSPDLNLESPWVMLGSPEISLEGSIIPLSSLFSKPFLKTLRSPTQVWPLRNASSSFLNKAYPVSWICRSVFFISKFSSWLKVSHAEGQSFHPSGVHIYSTSSSLFSAEPWLCKAGTDTPKRPIQWLTGGLNALVRRNKQFWVCFFSLEKPNSEM